jgi:hypothetical protein
MKYRRRKEGDEKWIHESSRKTWREETILDTQMQMGE